MPAETRKVAAPDPLARTMQAQAEITPNDDLIGEKMVLNMGPSHPATHGVLRLVLELDGELVTKATPDITTINLFPIPIGSITSRPWQIMSPTRWRSKSSWAGNFRLAAKQSASSVAKQHASRRTC